MLAATALQLVCGVRLPAMRRMLPVRRCGCIAPCEWDDTELFDDPEEVRDECQRLKHSHDSVPCSGRASTDSLPVLPRMPTPPRLLTAGPTPPRLPVHSSPARFPTCLLPSVFHGQRRSLLASPMASTDSLPSVVPPPQQRNGVLASPIASTDSLPSCARDAAVSYRRFAPGSPLQSTDALPCR